MGVGLVSVWSGCDRSGALLPVFRPGVCVKVCGFEIVVCTIVRYLLVNFFCVRYHIKFLMSPLPKR